MTEHFSNPSRVNRFEVAMLTLDDLYEFDLPTMLIDILADARHWCDRSELSFADLDRMAYEHYLAELHEEGGAA